jgi:peptidoglycan hydrolase-like protein with peptidoglycan-binding domain
MILKIINYMKKINKTVLAFLSMFFIASFIGVTTLFAASPTTVNLGSAGNFTILAKTGVSTTGTTSVVGNIGVSPAAATFITGFGLILPAASDFSTSSLVSGKIFAPDYANPTPANLTTAVLDMQTAYTDASGRAAGVTELGAGNIGGLTLAPGVYKWGTGVTIPTDVTISGSATDVWIFQIAQNLDISSATNIVLAGGAQASNIFWVVAGQTTIGTTAVFNGNILDQTAIVLNTGATLNGKALAQTAVTLDANPVTSASTYEFPVVVKVLPPVSGNYVNTSTSGNVSVINPVTTTNPMIIITPEVTIHLEEGCSQGNAFSTVNGKVCNNNIITTTEGCSSGNLFSIVNGKVCNNNTLTTTEGCSQGNAFSTVNGKVCNNNILKVSFGFSSLSLGSTGDFVNALQTLVGAEADGTFGPNTKAKVMIWQKTNGLYADGVFGPMSKAKVE